MQETRTHTALSLAGAAFRPAEFWRRVRAGSANRASVAVLLVLVAALLHIAASASRIAALIVAPLPAATMSPTHRLAEAALAVAAPASRFSGAELWNVSRNAGPTEFRGGDAVVAFARASLLICASPWRGSVVIERHPNANWASQSVELTPSLEPLLNLPSWMLLAAAAATAFVMGTRAQAHGTPAKPSWMKAALMTPVLPAMFALALACNALPVIVALPVFAACASFTTWRWLRPIKRAAP